VVTSLEVQSQTGHLLPERGTICGKEGLRPKSSSTKVSADFFYSGKMIIFPFCLVPSRHSTRNFQRNRSVRYRKSSSSSSSSDSGYDQKKNRRHLTVGYSKDKSRRGDFKKKGSNLADTDPMEINPDIKFDNVGGLPEHIKALKEMIVFPMMYTEVFEKFKITPPKGVLFHGPPGELAFLTIQFKFLI
jgi:hypothetical protein